MPKICCSNPSSCDEENCVHRQNWQKSTQGETRKHSKKPTANDSQVGGIHYRVAPGALQHWDIVDRHKLDYFQGQITKYVMRWRDKGGLEDLKKAQHFLTKYIELNEPRTLDAGPLPNEALDIIEGRIKNPKREHHSDAYFSLEGVQGIRAEYTCRKCHTTFWVGWNESPHDQHDCPGRNYVSPG